MVSIGSNIVNNNNNNNNNVNTNNNNAIATSATMNPNNNNNNNNNNNAILPGSTAINGNVLTNGKFYFQNKKKKIKLCMKYLKDFSGVFLICLSTY